MKIKIFSLALFSLLLFSCKENKQESSDTDNNPQEETNTEKSLTGYPYKDIISNNKQLNASSTEVHIIAETQSQQLGLKGEFVTDGSVVKKVTFEAIPPFKNVASAKFKMVDEVYTLAIELEGSTSNGKNPISFNLTEIPDQIESDIQTRIDVQTETDSLFKPYYKGHVFKRPTE